MNGHPNGIDSLKCRQMISGLVHGRSLKYQKCSSYHLRDDAGTCCQISDFKLVIESTPDAKYHEPKARHHYRYSNPKVDSTTQCIIE